MTADRGLDGISDSASSVAIVTGGQIAERSGFSLDDALHTVAGVQLFRRTSSWSANPTSQGISLRGLGSTAASRTLVVSDQVPLNDPFGGWVHWNEIPMLAIDQVGLVRGGAADLYGSSAIGGVVDIVPVLPPAASGRYRIDGDASGANEHTAQEDGLLTAFQSGVGVLAAASGLRTDGFIPTAPAFRGSVDVPAGVTGESGRVEVRPEFGSDSAAFVRGNLLNESRDNGTPLQTNATRLWRYQAGGSTDSAELGHAEARLFGSREEYRQSFSAIAANRNTERLTQLQRVPVNEFGGVLQAARTFPAKLSAAIGVDLRDVRATDDESAVADYAVTGTTSTSARQRETGGYADAIWQPRGVSLSGSVRVDSFRTVDAHRVLSSATAVTPLPTLDELVASPRAGLVISPVTRLLPAGTTFTATAFRAFRGPTMNELYRTGQVGSQTTLANPSLQAERATGFEFGGNLERNAIGNLRATCFWTEVNRPISAVSIQQTATAQTLQRENLGQIRSRGVMLEAQSRTWRDLSATLSYQFAVATVTRFNAASPAQQNLLGNWIPEVPRQSLIVQATYSAPRIATVRAAATYNGQQFDDAENMFVLHPFARFDVYAERAIDDHLTLDISAQNLLDRDIDAGRTPVLTLAAPRIVQAGVRFQFSR